MAVKSSARIVALGFVCLLLTSGDGSTDCRRQQDVDRCALVRPYSSRAGGLITILPAGVSFRLPDEWAARYVAHADNLHLSHVQLDSVRTGEGDWLHEQAAVCNALIPFGRCAAHVGDYGWREGVGAYSGIQLRVYALDDSNVAGRRFLEQAEEEIIRLYDVRPVTEQLKDSKWQRCKITFRRFYGDYGGYAVLDCRFTSNPKGEFVLVFMYTDYEKKDKEIMSIINSFN